MTIPYGGRGYGGRGYGGSLSAFVPSILPIPFNNLPDPPSGPIDQYHPEHAYDPILAHEVSRVIAYESVPKSCLGVVAPTYAGTYKNLEDYFKCGDKMKMRLLQEAAGIHPADGSYNSLTQAAYEYFLIHTTRPDGSYERLSSTTAPTVSSFAKPRTPTF